MYLKNIIHYIVRIMIEEFVMSFFYKSNVEIDSKLLNELKKYVSEKDIKSTVENLIKDYIKQQKPALSVNQEKVSNSLKNWSKKENSEYRTIICSFFKTQDEKGMSSRGKMQRYCEKNQAIHFTTYFSQLIGSSSSQGKFFREDKYKEVSLEDDVKDMIIDFYKNISAQNTENIIEDYEGISYAPYSDMSKSRAIALLSSKNYQLHSCVTFASTNRASGTFWANPNVEFLKCDWSFILNDIKNRKLYLLDIPKNTFDKTKLPLKTPDLLQISLEPETLISTYSDRTAFRPYKVAEISY